MSIWDSDRCERHGRELVGKDLRPDQPKILRSERVRVQGIHLGQILLPRPHQRGAIEAIMAVGLDARLVEILSSIRVPFLQTVENPSPVPPRPRRQQPRVPFEEVEHVAVEFPEIVHEGGVLVQEHGSAHGFDCGADEQFLNEGVQVFVLDPVAAADVQSIDLFGECGSETVSEVLQAGAVEEPDGFFARQEIVPVFGGDVAVRVGLRVDPGVVGEVYLHGFVGCVEEVLE